MAAPKVPGVSVTGDTMPSSVNGVEGHACPQGSYVVAAGDCQGASRPRAGETPICGEVYGYRRRLPRANGRNGLSYARSERLGTAANVGLLLVALVGLLPALIAVVPHA